MTIYDLKPRFQALLRPFTSWLFRRAVTANMVTVAAMLASLAYGAWMLLSASSLPYLLLPLFMFARMALNAVDGMLAREHGQQSKLGAVLNEVGDLIADAALLLPFATLPGVHPQLVCGVVYLSTLTEFIGVLGQVTGAGRRYDGPSGKSDRAFVFGLLGLLIGLGLPVLPYLDPVLIALLVLLALTCWKRARRAAAGAA
ncbi:CDP-alcohol phosphatidyltransferase family protein [Massilia atriviolacea]|uniref:CDP-alcohol phosphatidyltransferase family protein n=1 Tax=Massilia atriviolacea TaxID=2495579 RepID=A0A430HIU9_9BURK|nr:CDP-alcohol phosphatidyltransferase family protein [Massilia atriviolacea]RSZ57431.1 CDP-alcohol phosphatidyltransferase family protein [Massilia atriviolacea]